MPYLVTINLQIVLCLVSILASQAYGSISIVCGGGGITAIKCMHERLLLFGPGNEANSVPEF